MGLKVALHSDNADLKAFFDQINKYSDGVHSLNNGVDIDHILQTERELNVGLPQIYKEFLQVCNGGELFIPGTVLAGIYYPELGEKQRGASYLNESLRENRRRPGMTNILLIIADLNYGDSICFDLSTNNGYDARVVQWDRESQSISRSWEEFKDWIMDVIEEGSMLVNYDGSNKDLEF
ncbi:SMI1/KNR4 family protein [Paenibacillus glufosinatiresistens]|uniref:SMI1/KNR4 family protein n=1 Tax=Paenibacillus glufosinatiresistens TaxID=3070657 RepID=UPI00286EA829|nr:SMI1/KNR4 family protein [Paenibacillus sp. YX.27]